MNMLDWFKEQLKNNTEVITGEVYFLSVGDYMDATPVLKACANVDIFDLSDHYEYVGMSGNYPILKIKELRQPF